MGQGVGEKLFVGVAFVDVDTLAFATVFAHRKILALLAFFFHLQAFLDKLHRNGVF